MKNNITKSLIRDNTINSLLDVGCVGRLFSSSNFMANPQLVTGDVESVVLSSKFLKEHKEILKDNTFISEVIANGGNSYKVPPINGKNYIIYINTIIDNLKRHNLLTEYASEPIGLILTSRAFSLITTAPNKDNMFDFLDSFIYPFELNGKYKYLVVAIDNSDNDPIDCSYRFNSFSSITIFSDEEIIGTNIRIADDDGRWSEWLEFTEDISLNINYYKIYTEYRKLMDGKSNTE